MSLKKLKPVGNGGVFRWELALRVGDRRIHRKFDDTIAGAHSIYADLLHAKNREDLQLPGGEIPQSITLEHALSEYEKHIVRIGFSATHIANAARALNLLKEIAGENAKLKAVTRNLLAEWQSQRARKTYGAQKKLPTGRTVNKDFDCVSGFLTYCWRQRRWFENNPARGMTRLREKPAPVKFQEWEHFEKFIEAAWEYRPALAMLFEVVGESGCRVMEAANAKVGEVDAARKQWAKIIKRGRHVIIPAGAFVLAAAEGRDSKSILCAREDGKAFRYNAIEWAVPVICEKAGVPRITAHHLRHARAVWDLEADIPIYTVRIKLGHTSVKTTEIYLKMATRRGQPERVRTPIDTRVKSWCQLVTKQGPEDTTKPTKLDLLESELE